MDSVVIPVEQPSVETKKSKQIEVIFKFILAISIVGRSGSPEWGIAQDAELGHFCQIIGSNGSALTDSKIENHEISHGYSLAPLLRPLSPRNGPI